MEGWQAEPSQKLVAFGVERIAFYELPQRVGGWSGQMSPFAIRISAGWPMRSMTGSIWYHNVVRARSGIDIPIPTMRNTIAFDRTVAEPFLPKYQIQEMSAMPLRPLWGGLVLNTMFFGLTPWLLLVAPFALRRWLRERTGRCVKCAYPIGTSNVCTECGATLPDLTKTTRGSMG